MHSHVIYALSLQIRNTKINQCVDTLGKRSANDTVTHYRCLPTREVGYTSQVNEFLFVKRITIASIIASLFRI